MWLRKGAKLRPKELPWSPLVSHPPRLGLPPPQSSQSLLCLIRLCSTLLSSCLTYPLGPGQIPLSSKSCPDPSARVTLCRPHASSVWSRECCDALCMQALNMLLRSCGLPIQCAIKIKSVLLRCYTLGPARPSLPQRATVAAPPAAHCLHVLGALRLLFATTISVLTVARGGRAPLPGCPDRRSG